jgi:hypothetical protein
MTHAPTHPPPTDPIMRRKLKALTHPDDSGDHELFTWTVNQIETACSGSPNAPTEVVEYLYSPPGYSSREADPARILYDASLGFIDEFVVLTLRAVSVGRHAEEPYRSLVALLIDCPADERGRAAARQERGATYGQLGRIAHDAGMTRGGRYRGYELACSIPLSEKHASHIIGRMGERRATWSSGSTSSGADAGSCARFRAEGAAGAASTRPARPTSPGPNRAAPSGRGSFPRTGRGGRPTCAPTC